MQSNIKKIFLIIIVAFSNQLQAQNTYFPPFGQWENRKPEQLKVNHTKLQEAVDFAKSTESDADPRLKVAHYESAFGREPFGYPVGPMKTRGPATGLIIYKGYIIAQWGEPERVDLTFSVAKSFLSVTTGLAYDKKLIVSEQDLVYPYMAPIIPFDPLKAWQNKADHLQEDDVFELFGTPHNKKITWDHLLRQTSDWEGVLWGKPDWADRPQGNASDWIKRPRNEPGTVYKYNDTRVNVLALALLNVWRKPLPQVLKEQLMDKIGASPTWRWTGYENSYIVLDGQIVQSVSGGSHWGGGLFINAYDQARFGYLTMKNGKWGNTQIISEEWLKKAKTPTPVQENYGFMNFFLNHQQKELPDAPQSAFYHLGAGTNFVYCDAENDLVIVARWIQNNQTNELVKKVIESLNSNL
jgi:CubicO group peptidase (beta-lactamase class C family)